MLKKHPNIRKFLGWLAGVVVCFLIYLLIHGAIFGVDAGQRLPDHEEIVQVEVWSSDSEKIRIETRMFTDTRDVSMVCNLLDALCDYHLLYMGGEDIPRLTVKMSLTDGGEYTIVIGNESVNFNGTFKQLRNKDAAKILAEQLLR